MEASSGDIGLAVSIEVADLRVHPGDIRAPGRPKRRDERAAVGQTHPPLTRPLDAPDHVGFAVAIKIGEMNVHPSCVGIPTSPGDAAGQVGPRG